MNDGAGAGTSSSEVRSPASALVDAEPPLDVLGLLSGLLSESHPVVSTTDVKPAKMIVVARAKGLIGRYLYPATSA